MSDSKLNDVMETLFTVFDAAVDVTTFDGPPAELSASSYVAVGWNGDPDDLDGEFATVDNEWLYVGSTAQLETVEIVCAVVAWSGDQAWGPRRIAATDLYSACNTALRAALFTDPVLQALVRESIEVSRAVFSGGQSNSGNYCRGVFTVRYRAQI